MMTNPNLPPTLAEQLAAFFRAHQGEWIDGRKIATIAGCYAWRTRISDIRRAPFNLQIVNRQRRVTENGETFTVSEYVCLGERGIRAESDRKECATSDAPTSPAAL